MEDGSADRELLERAREGDARAFRALVERHESAVAAIVIGMLGPGPDAEDVGQETFVRLYRSLDRFRGDAALRTYLTRIAINLSLNARKRRKRGVERFDSLDTAPSEATRVEGPDLERLEARRVVRAALDRLDARHRAVVVLRMIEGYSTRETAGILQIPEGTVLSRLSRGMQKLEVELASYVADEPTVEDDEA